MTRRTPTSRNPRDRRTRATADARSRRTTTASRRGSPQLRLRVGFVIIAMVLSVFGARLVQLQGVDAKAYAAKAVANSTVTIVLPAERGDILDRNGRPLADSVDGLMLIADPQQTRDKAPQIATFLAQRLGLDYFDTLHRLRRTDSRFQYLARRLPAALASRTVAEAEKLGFKGLGTERDPARDYPAHDVAANLIGFLGTPDPRKGVRPLAGFERTFNKMLAGHDGTSSYQVGGGVRIPLADSTITEPVDGKDLTTTIDLDLSWYTQRVLRQAVDNAHADSGVAIVMDTRTGEVLALADYPTYDATKPLDSPKDDLGSRALSDVYEPGSVEKVLTVSSLIDAGLVTPRTKIVVPPELDRQDRVIHDWFVHGTLHMTLAGVIAKSSNIGTVRASDAMPPRRLVGYLRAFGLGQPTDVGVAGESAGIVPSGAALTSQVKDRMTFGQSLSVNALQEAAAINAIANGGTYVTPSLIRGTATTNKGEQVGTDHTVERRVVSAKAAHQTMLMMERVVDPDVGVAPLAAVAGYRVAGKTGTAQRVVDGRYDGSTTVSFAGFAPADEPRFTVYVVVQNPRIAGAGGGSVAGPVFSKLMGFALHRYGIQPTGTEPSRLPVEW
ncbi:MAG: penicillin-binding protein 2 [Nocardioidaceae bacterium]|nr:penicillin-binding protein 2 [Nocardioidaceae bacterium]